jgi:hypothetical protein
MTLTSAASADSDSGTAHAMIKASVARDASGVRDCLLEERSETRSGLPRATGLRGAQG